MYKFSKNKKIYIPLILFICCLLCISGIFIYQKDFVSSENSTSESSDSEVEANNKEENTDKPETPVNRFEGLTMTNDNVGIPVLYYHAVGPDHPGEELYVTPNQLKEQLQLIKDLGYKSLTMAEVNDYIKNNKPIPAKSILITFDDGYENNYQYAYPILKELDIKATIFMVSDYIDKGFYLSSDQIKEMIKNGIDIESHTSSHLHLNQVDYNTQLKELKDSKAAIEAITNKKVLSIAYPYGDYDANSTKAAIDAGYSLAFTTDNGLADRTDNPVSLNRIYVNSNNSLEIFKNRLLKAHL